jgi:hypothetical protein
MAWDLYRPTRWGRLSGCLIEPTMDHMNNPNMNAEHEA